MKLMKLLFASLLFSLPTQVTYAQSSYEFEVARNLLEEFSPLPGGGSGREGGNPGDFKGILNVHFEDGTTYNLTAMAALPEEELEAEIVKIVQSLSEERILVITETTGEKQIYEVDIRDDLMTSWVADYLVKLLPEKKTDSKR